MLEATMGKTASTVPRAEFMAAVLPFLRCGSFVEGWSSEAVRMGAFVEVWILEVYAGICLDAVNRRVYGRFRLIKVNSWAMPDIQKSLPSLPASFA